MDHRDRRAVIAHTQLVQPPIARGSRRLGVIANFEPLWACLDPTMEELTIPRLGPERSALQYPIGSIAGTGARVSFGSDWPVSSMHPLARRSRSRSRARTRDGTPESGWLPEERLPIQQALAAYTSGTAYQGFEDDTGGSIVVGKRADLCALSADISAIAGREVSDVEVTGTWTGREGGARGVTGERGSVELTDVTKRFGTTVAVDSLNLDVQAGEFLVAPRPERLRQDHDAAHARGLRAARRGLHPHLRPSTCRASRRTSGT